MSIPLKFDSANSSSVYDNQHKGYGFTISNFENITGNTDLKKLQADRQLIRELRSFERNFIPNALQKGNIVFIQKGRNKVMTNPFVISDITPNPNSNVSSLSIEFTPISTRSYTTSVYIQTTDDPRHISEPVSFTSFCEHITWKDRNVSLDNGHLYIAPDKYIFETFSPDDFRSDIPDIVSSFI